MDIVPIKLSTGVRREMIPGTDKVDSRLMPFESYTAKIKFPESGANYTIAFLPFACLLQQTYLVIRGGTSVTVDIAWAASRGSTLPDYAYFTGAVVTTQSTPNSPTLIGNTINANTWVWMELGAVAGAVEELSVTIEISRT